VPRRGSVLRRGLCFGGFHVPSIRDIARAVLMILVLAAVCWLLVWAIGYCEIDAPFNKIAKGIVVIGSIFCLIGILLDLVGIVNFRSPPKA
jgi:uncharacterized membrane protein